MTCQVFDSVCAALIYFCVCLCMHFVSIIKKDSLSCTGAGYFPNPKMLSNDDGVEQTKDRENEESFCEPLPTCMLDIFRQIGEGTQANLYILYQFYGEDLGNVPSYTLHGSERGASIVELEPSGKVHDIP